MIIYYIKKICNVNDTKTLKFVWQMKIKVKLYLDHFAPKLGKVWYYIEEILHQNFVHFDIFGVSFGRKMMQSLALH